VTVLTLRDYVPSKREVVANLLVALGIPGALAVYSGVKGESVTFIVLTTLGALVLIALLIALVQWIVAPYRNRVLTGKELIQAVDTWLGHLNLKRGSVPLEGYAFGLEVNAPNVDMKAWVGLDDTTNTLVFISGRTDSQSPLSKYMGSDQLIQMKFEIAMEIARFGAYYRSEESPPSFTIWYWSGLPVDRTLTSANVIEKLDFVGRLDALVMLQMGKHAHAALSQPTQPPTLPNWMQPATTQP